MPHPRQHGTRPLLVPVMRDSTRRPGFEQCAPLYTVTLTFGQLSNKKEQEPSAVTIEFCPREDFFKTWEAVRDGWREGAADGLTRGLEHPKLVPRVQQTEAPEMAEYRMCVGAQLELAARAVNSKVVVEKVSAACVRRRGWSALPLWRLAWMRLWPCACKCVLSFAFVLRDGAHEHEHEHGA